MQPTSDASPLRRMQVELERAGADLLAIAPAANLQFAFGLERAPVAYERLIVLLVTRTASAMVLPDFDADEFAAHTGHRANFPWADRDGPAAAVQQAFASLSLPPRPRCLIDPDLSFAQLLALRARLGDRAPESAGPLLQALRLVKGPAAQAAMTAAGEIVSTGIDAALREARPGMTERELKRVVEDALWAAGATEIAIVLVQAGANSASPHHQADDTLLQEDAPVLIDVTAAKDGYFADITQQVVLGTPSTEYLAAYDVVHAAQRAGVAAARAGATAHDVATAASAPILAVPELAPWKGPRTGHGIGIEVHEAPSVVEGSRTVLPAGAAITVEPGVYIPGRFGIRIEDTVIVRDNDPAQATTRGSRELTIRADGAR